VSLAPKGALPATQFVRGSNNVMLSAHADRLPGRVIVLAALDNLVKGSAGQAIQNFNLMAGLPETDGARTAGAVPVIKAPWQKCHTGILTIPGPVRHNRSSIPPKTAHSVVRHGEGAMPVTGHSSQHPVKGSGKRDMT
jgi:hypothetical protein